MMNVRRVVVLTCAAAIGLGVLGAGTLAGAASASGPAGAASASGPASACSASGPAGAGSASGASAAGGGRGGDNRSATAGTCLSTTAAASGTLTADQAADLAFMIEEEKLAHDVYTTMAATYDVRVFSRIAAAETQHLTTLRTLAASYGVDDPSSDVLGEFVHTELATMYTELVARGSTSVDEAYAVGRAIENDDLARLAEAGDGVSAPDLEQTYTRLTSASRQHLVAFGG